MRFRFFYKANLILILSVLCLFSLICHAQNETRNTDDPATMQSEAEIVDPTMARANDFIGRKPSEAYEHYRRLEREFTKNLVKEDRVVFNRWWSGISSPIFIATWEKEWQEHPESHAAFALYIRDEVKQSRHLRDIEELSPTITDDEKLFYNYLNYKKNANRENIQEQSSLEERLRIPNELKEAAQNPEAYLFLVGVYKNYIVTQSNRKLEEKWKQEEAVAIAARKAIVPVDRNSREYQDAFLAYKNAAENEKQVILTAQKNDPTWARARYLLKIQGLGTVPTIGAEEKKFTETLDDTKRAQFNLWKGGFCILTSINATKKEWKEEPDSRPAILFCTNIAQAKVKSEEKGEMFDQSSVDPKVMLGGDEKTLEEFFSSLRKKNSESLAQMDALEKAMRISSKLKDEIQTSVIDSTLFLFYDTYFRTFTPDLVNVASRDVSVAIDKLNLLRPDWATEEKVEFPDEISETMHQLGLNDRVQWTWLRILLISTGGLFVLLAMINIIKNYLSKRRAGK